MKLPDDIDFALLYWFTVAILLMVVVGFVLAGCTTPPVPKHDAAVDQAMNKIYACEWQHEGNRRPEVCE